MPFSEGERKIEQEMAHFTSDMAIGGALFMSAGFRNLV